jgi:hypothetical protein
MTSKIEERIGNLVPLNREQITQFNKELDNLLDAETNLSKSALNVAILISKSGSISKRKVDTFNSISNTEVNGFTKRFVMDSLGIADYKSYNSARKEGLKRSMKVALALIKTDSLGSEQIDSGKVAIKKSSVDLESNNPTKYDSSATAQMVNIPMNYKEADSWAKNVLTFVESPNKKSELCLAMIKLQDKLDACWNEAYTKVTFKADARLEMNNTFNALKDFIEQVKKQSTSSKDKINIKVEAA